VKRPPDKAPRAAEIQSFCPSRKEDLKIHTMNGSQVRLCFRGRFGRHKPKKDGCYETRRLKKLGK
jgi:hypothetical protein